MFFIQIFAKLFIGLNPGGSLFLLVGVAALAINFFAGFSLPVAASGILVFTLFFALGLKLKVLNIYDLGVAAMFGAIAIFAGVELVAMINQVSAESFVGRLSGIVLAVAFVVFFYSTRRWRLWSWTPIKFIGLNTLAIYCMHSIFTAGCRTPWSRLGGPMLPA